MARRTRDLTVPSGRLSSAAISPWARPSKNESCKTRTCSGESSFSAARTRSSRSAALSAWSGCFRHFGLDHLERRIKLRPFFAAQPIDAQIARDRENPRRGAGARRIEISGLAPHRQQRLLRDIFGRIGRRAEPHQHRLDPRRIELEQRRERGPVLVRSAIALIQSAALHPGRARPSSQHDGSAPVRNRIMPGKSGPK